MLLYFILFGFVLCQENKTYSSVNWLGYTKYAEDGDYAYAASLQQKDPNNHYCTGVLVSSNIIATSAFCAIIIDYEQSSWEKVRMEELNVRLESRFMYSTIDKYKDVDVINIYVHEDLKYDPNLKKLINDACVIKINKFLDISPIQLPQDQTQLQKMASSGAKCVLVGWGVSPVSYDEANKSSIPDDLAPETKMVLQVYMIKEDACKKLFCDGDKNSCSRFDQMYVFCVMPYVAREGPCRAPYGMPLICNDELWGVGSTISLGDEYCDTKINPIFITKPQALEVVFKSSGYKIQATFITIFISFVFFKSVLCLLKIR